MRANRRSPDARSSPNLELEGATDVRTAHPLRHDPRPAREQINEHYRHGGGWQPFVGIKMEANCLRYPGDPPFPLLAETHLRKEIVRLYGPGSWLAIIQPDGSYEVAKID